VKRLRRQSTIPKAHPPRSVRRPGPPAVKRPARMSPPRPHIAHIVDQSEASLLDVIDNLLNKGVVLNADVILALANVDLVYVRLSALLCAADRIIPRTRR
jgi:Gas vesicle protein